MKAVDESPLLHYARTTPRVPWWEQLPRWWRSPIVAGAFLSGSYFVAHFRTMTYGTTLRLMIASVVIAVLFTAPAMAAAVIGIPWRRAVVRWLLLAMLSALAAEAWAQAQELAFARKIRAVPPKATAWEGRCWPFEDHAIAYDPDHGFFGQD